MNKEDIRIKKIIVHIMDSTIGCRSCPIRSLSMDPR